MIQMTQGFCSFIPTAGGYNVQSCERSGSFVPPASYVLVDHGPFAKRS